MRLVVVLALVLVLVVVGAASPGRPLSRRQIRDLASNIELIESTVALFVPDRPSDRLSTWVRDGASRFRSLFRRRPLPDAARTWLRYWIQTSGVGLPTAPLIPTLLYLAESGQGADLVALFLDHVRWYQDDHMMTALVEIHARLSLGARFLPIIFRHVHDHVRYVTTTMVELATYLLRAMSAADVLALLQHLPSRSVTFSLFDTYLSEWDGDAVADLQRRLSVQMEPCDWARLFPMPEVSSVGDLDDSVTNREAFRKAVALERRIAQDPGWRQLIGFLSGATLSANADQQSWETLPMTPDGLLSDLLKHLPNGAVMDLLEAVHRHMEANENSWGGPHQPRLPLDAIVFAAARHLLGRVQGQPLSELVYLLQTFQYAQLHLSHFRLYHWLMDRFEGVPATDDAQTVGSTILRLVQYADDGAAQESDRFRRNLFVLALDLVLCGNASMEVDERRAVHEAVFQHDLFLDVVSEDSSPLRLVLEDNILKGVDLVRLLRHDGLRRQFLLAFTESERDLAESLDLSGPVPYDTLYRISTWSESRPVIAEFVALWREGYRFADLQPLYQTLVDSGLRTEVNLAFGGVLCAVAVPEPDIERILNSLKEGHGFDAVIKFLCRGDIDSEDAELRVHAIAFCQQLRDGDETKLLPLLSPFTDDEIGLILTGLFKHISASTDPFRLHIPLVLTYAIQRGQPDILPRIVAGDDFLAFRTHLGGWMQWLRQERAMQVRIGRDSAALPEFQTDANLEPVADWLRANFQSLSDYWQQTLTKNALTLRDSNPDLRHLLQLAALRRADFAVFMRWLAQTTGNCELDVIHELSRYYTLYPDELDSFAVDRLTMLPLEQLASLPDQLPGSLNKRIYDDFQTRHGGKDPLEFLKIAAPPVEGSDAPPVQDSDEDPVQDSDTHPVKSSDEESWSCPICFQDTEIDRVSMHAGHDVCRACTLNMLSLSKRLFTCPICRLEIDCIGSLHQETVEGVFNHHH